MKDHLELNQAEEFLKWKNWYTFYLHSKGWEVHMTATQPPPESNAEERQAFLKNQAAVMALLFKTINSKFNNLIVGKTKPVEILEALEKTFSRSKFQQVNDVEKKLDSLRYNQDPNKFYSYIRGLVNKYKSIGGKLSDHHISKKVLDVIPETQYYVPVKLNLMKAAQTNNGNYNLDDVLDQLEEIHRQLRDKGVSTQHHDRKQRTNLKTFKTSRKPIGVCKNCGQFGHFQSQCRNQRKEVPFCYQCGREDHLSNRCPQKSQKSVNKTSELKQWSTFIGNVAGVESSSNDEQIIFCLDSGATKHFVKDINLLDELKEVEKYSVVNSFGRRDEGNQEGRFFGKLDNGLEVVLNDVLHTKEIGANLMSIMELTKRGLTVTFKDHHAVIMNPQKEVLYRAPFNGSYYEVKFNKRIQKCNEVQTLMTNLDLWHNRFGHISKDYLTKMKQGKMCYGLDFGSSEELSLCHGCAKGNLKRFPVRRELDVNKADVYVAQKPLEKLHLDTCGPFEVQSRDKFKGFLAVTDEVTRFRWSILIKSRSEIPESLMDLIEKLESRHEGLKVRCLRSDQGTEFTNKRLEEFCRGRIYQEFSAVYTPEQNGKSERSIGLVEEGARSMLAHANLAKHFWSYAVRTKTYLLNRSFTNTIGQTPFEALHGRKPSVKHLRTFGSIGYSKVVKNKRGKLNPKGIPVMMLGYAHRQQGYFILNLETKRTEITRTAVFEEDLNKLRSYEVSNLAKPHRAKKEQEEKTEVGEFDFEEEDPEIDEEIETVEQKKVQSKEKEVRNFTDLDERNIINRREGVQTRSRTKNYKSRFLALYKTKVEKSNTPTRYSQIVGRYDREKWYQSYDKEVNKLTKIGNMEVVDKPKNEQVIPILELFTRKVDSLTGENICKCRFVARGDLERSSDVRDLYSPVASVEVTRLIVAISAYYKCKLRQADVTSAFLHGTLNGRIYVELPEKLKHEHGESKCWSTRKSLYGLNDAPLAWHKKIKTSLMKLGFKSCPVEPALFYYSEGKTKTFLVCYVDDLLYFSTNENHLDEIEEKLSREFELKLTKEATKFIGLEVRQTPEAVELSQTEYVQKMLGTFEMKEAKSMKTPMEHLLVPNNEGEKLNDPKLYQAILGSVNYVCNATRPGLSFSTNMMSKFN